MTLQVLLALFLSAISFANPQLEGKIVEGSDVKLGEFPYMVSVRKYNGHNCGGSILNNKFVLTAAHCVYKNENNPSIFSVQYGTIDIFSNNNIVPVYWVYMHEDFWNDASLRNDMAILELQTEIEFNSNVQPIKLATLSETPEGDAAAVLTGWGLNGTDGYYQNILKKVDITLFTDVYCKSAEKYFDADVQVCAGVVGGGKGQCSGDSGGPLTVNGKQFGVVSWSIKPCAGPNHPGVFARVTKYRDWIRKVADV